MPRQNSSVGSDGATPQRIRSKLGALGLLLAVVVVAALVTLAIVNEYRFQRELARERLRAVSDLRKEQVETWLDERMKQARFIGSSPFWASLFLQKQGGDLASHTLLIDRITEWRKQNDYDEALLLGADGEELARELEGDASISAELRAIAPKAFAEGAPLRTDIYSRNGAAIPLRLDVLIPLQLTGTPPQAAVVLRTDPQRWLFPTLRTWPVPTTSGESALWRRDGETVVAINPLRFAGTAAGQRFPLDMPQLAPARLMRGDVAERVMFDARDYRGVATLAIGQRIPDTEWWLVTEIDVDEVTAPARRAAIWIGLIGSAVLLVVFASARARTQHHALRERTQQLSRTDRQLTAIVDAAPVGILLVRDRRILRCNRKAEELCGYDPGELDGKHVGSLCADGSGDAVQALIHHQLASGGTAQVETQWVRKDATPFHGHLSARALEAGDLAEGIVCILQDMSAEHTARETLIQAKRAAEAVARSRQDFLSNMSHELRTPLNAMIGMAHLGLKTASDARQRDYLQRIVDAGERLAKLVSDMIDFSRHDTPRVNIDRIDFNLEAMLSQLIDQFRDRVERKGLELVLDIAADVPYALVGDSLRIGRILRNLLDNAVKFTAQGEIRLSVRARDRGTNDITLEISFADSGIGLTDEQKPYVFQDFWQADPSASRRFEGLGLGLPTAQRLARHLGGELGFDSEAGKGSRFWLSVPLGISRHQPAQLLPNSDLRGCPVLVVDDHPYARAVLVDMLTRMSFAVVEASTGEAAIDEIQHAAAGGKPIALVFIDAQLPTMSALETARRIALQGLRPAPRVILMSPTAGDKDDRRALDAALAGTLLKPATPSALFDAAVNALSGELRAQEERSANTADASPVRERLTDLRGKRVLVVEDNEFSRLAAMKLLTQAGFEVEGAETGEAAVDRVGNSHFDLVLMDLNLPVMDGFAATRAIRALPGGARLPIIALTANAMPGDRERCLEGGLDDHLAKPLDRDQLWQALERWLRPHAQPAPAAATPDAKLLGDTCGKLLQLLSDDSIEATHVLEHNSALLRAAFPDGYAGLAGAIEDFDLVTAHRILLSLCREHGIATSRTKA